MSMYVLRYYLNFSLNQNYNTTRNLFDDIMVYGRKQEIVRRLQAGVTNWRGNKTMEYTRNMEL